MKRTYKLTEKQKKQAAKWYKKGYTTHGRLSRKLGVSRQKVSNWLKSTKRGKRVSSDFWEDVKLIKQMKEITHKEAITEVKWSPRWYKKRIAGVNKREKAREEMKKVWSDIMQGKGDKRYWEQADAEDLMEAAEYGG